MRTQGDFNHYGPPLEIVHGLTFGEVALSFYANQDLDERVLFEEWQKLTYDTETYDIGYYQDYIGSVSVFVLDRQDKRRYGVRLEEAFPKSLDPIPLSYSSGSTINRVGVSIQYRYWTNLKTEDLSLNNATGEYNMALPQLNTPSYEMTVPSTGKRLSLDRSWLRNRNF